MQLVQQAPPEPAPTDPPDLSRPVLVRGCSVTAAGTVFGPSSPPFVKGVTFRIGAESRRLAVETLKLGEDELPHVVEIDVVDRG